MNAAAFKRGEAYNRLENYAAVITEHLALLVWYPDHKAKAHWQAEINAFATTLRRYDRGKKRDHNFRTDDIVEILMDEISDNDGKDAVLIAIEGHGVKAPAEPAWDKLHQAIKEFAKGIAGR